MAHDYLLAGTTFYAITAIYIGFVKKKFFAPIVMAFILNFLHMWILNYGGYGYPSIGYILFTKLIILIGGYLGMMAAEHVAEIGVMMPMPYLFGDMEGNTKIMGITFWGFLLSNVIGFILYYFVIIQYAMENLAIGLLFLVYALSFIIQYFFVFNIVKEFAISLGETEPLQSAEEYGKSNTEPKKRRLQKVTPYVALERVKRGYLVLGILVCLPILCLFCWNISWPNRHLWSFIFGYLAVTLFVLVAGVYYKNSQAQSMHHRKKGHVPKH